MVSAINHLGITWLNQTTTEADCRRLDIHSARLPSADLSGAVNLRQAQIDSAYGNSRTKLPDGVKIPRERLQEDE